MRNIVTSKETTDPTEKRGRDDIDKKEWDRIPNWGGKHAGN